MANQKTTEWTTGVGQIKFMAAARPINNKTTGKPEYSIKLELPATDVSIQHLATVADKKVNSPTNKVLEAQGSNSRMLSFVSDYQPVVTDETGQPLQANEVPYFDGRTDTGTAAVSYKVISFDDGKTIVRLSGIKLFNLTLAPRENTGAGDSLQTTLDKLNNIQA